MKGYMKKILGLWKQTQKILVRHSFYPHFLQLLKVRLASLRKHLIAMLLWLKSEWDKPLKKNHQILMMRYSPVLIPILLLAVVTPIIFHSFFNTSIPIRVIERQGATVAFKGTITHNEDQSYNFVLKNRETFVSLKGVSTPPEDLTIYVDKPSIQDTDIITNVLFVDDTNLAFETASIELTINGEKKPNAILTCSTQEFDTNTGTCSSWEIADITPTQEGKKIAFNVEHFSAYAGAYLEILNVQSNLTVGDIWEKRFITYGTSDLSVEAVDGTVYGTDVVHLEMYCGDTKLENEYQDDKIFIENYTCNGQLSRLVDRSITPGIHHLQFTFGETITLAKNFACDSGTLSDTCTVTSTQAISNGSTISGTGNLVIASGGNLTTNSTEAFSIDMDGYVTIQNGGAITGNLTSLTGSDFTLESTGSINANTKGYASSTGTGEGTNWATNGNGGGGAGHGGAGGDSNNGTLGGIIYGDMTAPTTFGSGGGTSGSSPGGAGGGAININVTGTASIAGTVSANGGAGTSSGGTNSAGGGGAGGSIYITAATISGAGTITSDGGAGSNQSTPDGGGGGGGRIALYYTSKTFSGTLRSIGGTGPDIAKDGAAGTIYQKPSSQTYADLTIDNTGKNIETPSQLVAGTYSLNTLNLTDKVAFDVQDGVSITITNAFNPTGSFSLSNSSSTGTISYPALDLIVSGTVTINGGSKWTIQDITVSSGTLTMNGSYSLRNLTLETGTTLNHSANSSTQTYDLQLNASGNITLNGTASINLDGRGYIAGNGTGPGVVGSGSDGGGGGGHGGSGGAGETGILGGSAYGSQTNPVTIGSGGGTAISSAGGAGGGAISLSASGTTTISSSSTISANGTNGVTNGASRTGGGGAGGSIKLTTNTLAGSGAIRANGGNGGNGSTADGGGGAGGRISVFSASSTFSGSITVTGGVGPDTAGEGSDGTTYNDLSSPTVSIDTICSTDGNTCTIAGAAADPQQAYAVTTLTGSSAEAESSLNSLQLSIKDTTTGQWYSDGTNAFDQGSETLLDPSSISQALPYTGSVTWSYDASGIPFAIDNTYLITVQVSNPRITNSTTKSFVFTNSPPEVTNISASQNNDGTVTVGYDVTDNESASTTVRLFYDAGITLASDMDTGTGDISVSSGTYLPSSGSILINNEMITYASKSGTTLSGITRGALNTTNVVHSSAATVVVLATTTSGNVGSTTNGTGKSITWTAKTDIDGFYSASAKIYVVANDGASSQMVDAEASSTFSLDVKDPAWTANFKVDASQADPLVTIPCSDDSSFQMKVGLSSDVSDVAWATYASTATISTLGLSVSDPFTIYGQCKDAKNNTSTILSATTPDSPDGMFFQDVSNSPVSEWREFVTWNVIDDPSPGFDEYQIYRKVDSGSYSQLTTITDRSLNYIIDTGLSTGSTYYYKVRATDDQGNISYYSSVVSDSPEGEGGTDNTNPVLTSVTSTGVSSTQATVTWTSNELATSKVYYKASASYPGASTSSYDNSVTVDSMVTAHSIALSSLTPNTKYYFLVTSDDASANTGSSASATYTFTTTDGPSISTVSTTSVFDSEATVSWLTDEAASSTVRYSTNSDLSSSTTATSSGNVTQHSVNITGLSANTKYYFQVESTDTDTNQSIDKNVQNGSVQYYTFTTTNDTVGPVISNLTAALVGQEGLTITWETNEVATSQLLWGPTSSVANSTTQTSVYTNFHSVTITGLTTETVYYYKAVSVDKSSNSTTSTIANSTTAEAVTSGDETPPTFSNIDAGSITSTGATITWTSNEDTDSFVKYGTASNNLDTTVGRVESTTSHSVTVNGLSGSTTYYFAVIGRDTDGNTGTSSTASFTTKATTNEELADAATEDNELISLVVDIVEKASKSFLQKVLGALINNPRITSLPEDEVVALVEDLSDKSISAPSMSTSLVIEPNAETAVIKWSTNKPANSLVAFATATDYSSDSSEPYTTEAGDSQAYTTSHEVTLVGLQPNTDYHIQARSKDRFGPVSESSDTTFTTTALTAEIKDLALASANETSVLVTWQTSIPTRYTASLVDTDTGEESVYTDNSYLKAHSLEATNLSPSTSYIALITAVDENGEETLSQPIPFSTITTSSPPKITDVKVVTSLISGKVEKVQSIISWKTDKPASSKVLYQQGVKTEGSSQEIIDETLKRDHIIITSAFTPGQVYQYNVISSDIAGNTAESQNYTLLTPRPQESVVDLIVKNVEDMFGFLR